MYLAGEADMLNVLCCDCNPQHLSELVNQLNMLPCSAKLNISAVTDPTQLEAVVSEQTDLLICDVLLGNHSGIALAKAIKKRFPHITILFVSIFLGYCEDIYGVEHIAFIRKPVVAEKLLPPVLKAMEQSAASRANYVLLRTKSITTTVHISSILYVETVGKQVNVVTDDSFYSLSHRLESILASLDARFAQYAEGSYVNMEQISVLNKTAITLFDRTVLPLEKHWYTSLKKVYIKYLSKRDCGVTRVKVLQPEPQ